MCFVVFCGACALSVCLCVVSTTPRIGDIGGGRERDLECESCELASGAVQVLMVGTVSAMWPSKLPASATGVRRLPRHGSRRPVVFRLRRRKKRKEASHRTAAGLRRCRVAGSPLHMRRATLLLLVLWAHRQMLSPPLGPSESSDRHGNVWLVASEFSSAKKGTKKFVEVSTRRMLAD